MSFRGTWLLTPPRNVRNMSTKAPAVKSRAKKPKMGPVKTD
jgi:hypothetical protein